MLIIRTGLQGHGKTLNTIKEVDLSAKAQDRPVYYHNVTDLKPELLKASWFPFDDPLLWYELPDNAIIVVDEAQGSIEHPMFGVRDPRKEVPLHCSHFEIMRKKGHEVHLITQDPRFLDVHVRRLCNKHIHYWRIFGSTKVSRFELPRVHNDVEKIQSVKEADRTIIGLDKNYFGVYSSAKAKHHFKFKPSKKAIYFAVSLLVTIYLCWHAYSRYTEARAATTLTAESAGQSVKDLAQSVLPGITPDESEQPLTSEQYIAQRTPRISGAPASAPLYDELTKPVAYPKTFCVSSQDPEVYARRREVMQSGVIKGKETVCQCYTQQGTRVNTDLEYCLTAVERGIFDPAVPDRGSQLNQQSQRSEPLPQGMASAAPEPRQQQGSAVRVVPYEKGRFLW